MKISIAVRVGRGEIVVEIYLFNFSNGFSFYQVSGNY